MKVLLVITALAALVQFLLALVVLIRSPYSNKNQTLFVILLFFSIWSALELALNFFSQKNLLFKIIVDIVFLLTFFFVKFVSIFPKTSSFYTKYFNKFVYSLVVLVLIAIILLNHLGYLFRTLEFSSNYVIIYFSNLEFIFKGVLVIFLLLSLKVISTTYSELESDLHKKRMRYTIAAILFPAATGPVILALSKYYLETATLYPYGLFPTLSLITALMLTYAILRYKLIEIDAIFTVSLIYTLLSVILAGIVEILENLLQDYLSLSEGWINIISVIAIAALFAPIKEVINVIINKIFGIEKIDVSKVIKNIITSLNDSTSVNNLYKKLSEELSFVLSCKKIGMILKQNDGIICIPNELSVFQEVISWNLKYNYLDISDLDSIIDICEEQQLPEENLFRELKNKEYKFLFQIRNEEEIKGLLFIGIKNNKSPYTTEEITLLTAINENLYSIIKNIELIQEVLEKNKLEREIQLAKKLYYAIQPQYVTEIDNNYHNYVISAFSSLAAEIKGDFIDFNISTNDDKFILLIDAFNKGVAAVITIYILHTIFHYVSIPNRLRYANIFLSKLNDPDLKAAVSYVRFNKSNLEICNLGNPAPLIIDCNNKTISEITNVGKPLGLLNHLYSFEPITLTISSNQILFIYTNGLAKVFGDLDGTNLKKKIINDLENITLSSLDRYLQFHINMINAKSNFADDVSYVCIWRKHA